MTTPTQSPSAHPGFLTDAEVMHALNALLGKTDPGGPAFLLLLDAIRALHKQLERSP